MFNTLGGAIDKTNPPQHLNSILFKGYCWSTATMVNFWDFFGNSQTWPQTVWQGVFSDIWPMIEVKLGQILGQIMSKVTKYWLDPLNYIWAILWKAKLCFSLTWHFGYHDMKCQSANFIVKLSYSFQKIGYVCTTKIKILQYYKKTEVYFIFK